MSTAITALPQVRPIPGRKYDRYFFSAMSALILLSVFIGFSHTYYLAGLTHAPLPNRLVHVHGAVFSSWVILLVVQSLLVSVRRVSVHRTLGLFGFGLACLMVLLGLWAATDSLARNSAPPGVDAKTFYVIPLGDMLNFGILIAFAFAKRTDSAAHKRLVMLATVSLLTAAFARFRVPFLMMNPLHGMLASYVFLVALAAYDLWSTHKVHRVTMLGSALVFVVQFARMPLSHTQAWQSFATWAQSLNL